jgi:hypothetical protein
MGMCSFRSGLCEKEPANEGEAVLHLPLNVSCMLSRCCALLRILLTWACSASRVGCAKELAYEGEGGGVFV